MEDAIAAQPTKMSLAFDNARLSLSNGSLPQLAIELSGLKVIAAPDCQNEPSLMVARLRVPLRIGSLIGAVFGRGKVGFGTVAAEDVVLDLDGFRSRCEARADSGLPEAVPNAIVETSQPPRADGSLPWWTPEQFEAVQHVVRGVHFRQVKIEFERRTKSILLQSFEADVREARKELRLQTHVKIPKELTQGGQLPDLEILADVKADGAQVTLSGRVSEGKIFGDARLTPLPHHQLGIDSQFRVSSLPLSTVVPLLTRVAVIKREMRPKFLWLNCEARISGRFQGLFHQNPLHLANCEVAGNGTKIHVAEATREPDGNWRPFSGTIESADMRQMFETFSVSGLDGIATDFGKFDGRLEVADRNSARLVGRFGGMQFRFSNHSERTVQGVKNIEADVRLHEDGRITGEIAKLDIDGGKFLGHIDFEFSKSAARGMIKTKVEKLRLREEVQRLMAGGSLENIQGDLAAEFSDGRLRALKGVMHLRGLDSDDWTFADLQLSPSLAEDGSVRLSMRSPELRLSETSSFYESAKPALFGRKVVKDGKVLIQDVQVLAEVPLVGGFKWMKANGHIEGGKIRLQSEGQFTREKLLAGVLSVDFPNVKKLNWDIAGTVDEPQFTFRESSANDRFNDLVHSGTVTEKVLGLPLKPNETKAENN